MKKLTYITIILLCLLASTPAMAQFSWGVKGGVYLGSNDLTILKDKNLALNVNNYTGFFIGPKAEVRLPVIGIGFEVATLYAQQGMELPNSERFKQNNIQIPLNVKYSIGLGNMANVFVEAGPEFGFNVGETSVAVNNLQSNDATNTINGSISAYMAEKSTLSVNIGLGITLLNHVQMGVSYNIPCSKTGEFTYIEASDIENVNNIKQSENITVDDVRTLAETYSKAQDTYSKIKTGTMRISVAYLF